MENEKMIILFGYDEGWFIRINFERIFKENIYNWIKPKYYFIMDIKKLPQQTIPLFDRMSSMELRTTKALFLLHICKSYLEEYKIE